ncbi:MAG: tyrosine-type recombinase/integrase [Bacteroidales bacterium]
MEFYKLSKLDDAGGNINCRWYAFYSYINPDTDKFQRFKIAISSKLKTKSARYKRYEEIKKQIDSQLQQGWNPFQAEKPELISIENALKLFLKVAEKSLRRRTIHTYSSFINRIIDWLQKEKLQNIPVSLFSYHHAQKFMDYLITNLVIGNRTYNNYVSTYRIVFNFFEKRDLLVKNPFMRVDFLKEDEGKIVAFTESEWNILFTYLPAEDPQLWIIANFIYYAALRPQEIMRLQFVNVDLARQKIYSLGVNSKNHKQQVIEIPDTFMKILKNMDWGYPSHYYLFSKNLLPGPVENYPNRISERWRAFANKHDILERNIYDLKHNAAGRLCDAGFDLRDIQLHFRHHSIEQTVEYFSKFRNISSERLKHNYPPFV